MKLWILLLLVVSLVPGCGFEKEKDASAVPAGHTPQAQGAPTLKLQPGHVYGFKSLQSTIFEARCAQCHENGVHKGSVALDTYASATAAGVPAKILSEVFVKKSMPPKKVSVMSDEEREIVAQWIDAGTPENDLDEAAPSPSVLPSALPSALPSVIPSAIPSPRPALKPALKVSYADVSPIFAGQCLKCHDSRSAHPEDGVTLNTYEEVKAFLDDIQDEVFTENDMPPDSQPPLSDADRSLLKTWIDQGAPQ